MTYRKYSDEDKAAALTALDLNEGNVNGTARALGMPDRTLQSWHEGSRRIARVAQLREHKKGEIAAQLETIIERMMNKLLGDGVTLENKVDKANLRDIAICFGILIDKWLLLKGEPTQIHLQSARETVKRVVEETGIDEASARRIVAKEFEVEESDLEM